MPYPDHILAALAVGDRVEITTDAGDLYAGNVTALTEQSLTVGDATVEFDDIRSIAKRSFGVPRNPCDDERPLGCSVPGIARVASEFHDRFAGYFQPSCRQHDYCYRHGNKTYGLERSDCDGLFLEMMKTQCSYSVDIVQRAECLLAAKHFHSAVVEHGEGAFLGERGRHCEYAGPRLDVAER